MYKIVNFIYNASAQIFVLKFIITHKLFVGPTVLHPQYYGVQTPWGIYPASIIQQGQQTPQGLPSQPLRNGSGRLTPSGQSDSLNNSSNQLQTLPAAAAQGEQSLQLPQKDLNLF